LLGVDRAREAHAADDRFGHDVGIDGVVRARDAFLEGVELHLAGQGIGWDGRIGVGIGHLTPAG
jgi:hypothetical protein